MDRDLILAEAEIAINDAIAAPMHLKPAAANNALQAVNILLRMMFFEIEKLQKGGTYGQP